MSISWAFIMLLTDQVETHNYHQLTKNIHKHQSASPQLISQIEADSTNRFCEPVVKPITMYNWRRLQANEPLERKSETLATNSLCTSWLRIQLLLEPSHNVWIKSIVCFAMGSSSKLDKIETRGEMRKWGWKVRREWRNWGWERAWESWERA